MVKLKVELNFEAVKKGMDLKRLIPKRDRKDFLADMCLALLELREIRIGVGSDNTGVGFAWYTEKYEEWKENQGTGRALYTKGDWLTLSGAMLAGQQIESDHKEGRLLFSPEEVQKALGNDRYRKFIAATQKEIDLAFESALRRFKKKAKK